MIRKAEWPQIVPTDAHAMVPEHAPDAAQLAHQLGALRLAGRLPKPGEPLPRPTTEEWSVYLAWLTNS
jgi:hypothetical protein